MKKIGSGPIVTLGALCGWIIGRFLAGFFCLFPEGNFRLSLELCLPQLCILWGALVAALATMPPAPSCPEPQPQTTEPPPRPLPLALFGHSCGMTWERRIFHAICWTLALLMVSMSSGAVSQRILQLFGIETPPQQLAELVKQIAHSPDKLLIFAFGCCILTPIAEEMLYRHLLPGVLSYFRVPNLLAVIISALLFTSVHEIPSLFLGLFLFALIQSRIARRTDLFQCMLIHGLYNAWTLVILLISALCHTNAM